MFLFINILYSFEFVVSRCFRDRDVVRSAVKSLGNCKLEANVTRNTTHIVSKGLRTISLLQGITRGCWIVSMNWVVQSMEQKSWLQPEQFEMGDLYKAVQVNNTNLSNLEDLSKIK